MIKLIAHETTMKIPIFNTLFNKSSKKLTAESINLNVLNNLNFKNVDRKKFPMINLLDYMPSKTLFETVIVSLLLVIYFKKK